MLDNFTLINFVYGFRDRENVFPKMTTLNFIDNKYQVKLSLTVFKFLLDFRLSDFKE